MIKTFYHSYSGLRVVKQYSILGRLRRFNPRRRAQKVSFSPLWLQRLFESGNDLPNQGQK